MEKKFGEYSLSEILKKSKPSCLKKYEDEYIFKVGKEKFNKITDELEKDEYSCWYRYYKLPVDYNFYRDYNRDVAERVRFCFEFLPKEYLVYYDSLPSELREKFKVQEVFRPYKIFSDVENKKKFYNYSSVFEYSHVSQYFWH